MAEVGKISVAFTADTSGFQKGKKSVEKGVSQVGKSLNAGMGDFSRWGATASNAANVVQGNFQRSSAGVIKSSGASTRAIKQQTRAVNENKFATDANSRSQRFFAGQLTQVAAAVTAALSAGQIIAYADAFTNAQNQIRQTTNSTEELKKRTEELFAIAERGRADINATAELYTQLTLSTKDLGLSTKEQLRLTETITKTFAVSGKSAAESAGAIRQLGQALASGALRGDEFNSIAEGAPEIMRALQQELKMTQGELRSFAATGGITAEILTTALGKYADVVDKKVSQATKTFAQNMQEARNNMIEFIGTNKDINNATSALGSGLVSISENLDTLTDIIKIAGGLLIGRLAGGLAASATALTANSIAAMKATTTANVYTGAITRTSAASIAATRALAGLRTGFAALGGPIGIAVAALLTLTTTYGEASSWTTQLKEDTEKLRKEFTTLSDTEKAVKLDGIKKQIESVRQEIDKTKKESKRFEGGFLGSGPIQDQIKVQKLTQELVKLQSQEESLKASTESLTERLIRMGGPITAMAVGIGATVSMNQKAKEAFGELSESVKAAIDDFRTLSAEEKQVKLNSIDEQIVSITNQISELKESIGDGLFGFVIGEDAQRLNMLSEQLEKLKAQREAVAAIKVSGDTGTTDLTKDEKAFLENEKNKTKIAQIELQERQKLNQIAQQFNAQIFESELEMRKAMAERIIAEEQARIAAQMEIAKIGFSEELAALESNEKLKGEARALAESEINARILASREQFNQQLLEAELASQEMIRQAKQQFADNILSGAEDDAPLPGGEGLFDKMMIENEGILEALGIRYQTIEEQELAHLERRKLMLDSALEAERITKEQHEQAITEIAAQEGAIRRKQLQNDMNFALQSFAGNSKKVQKIMKATAIANAVVKGYESAVSAWNAGMSVGGPWAPVVAAAYTAASLAKTGALIKSIKSAGKGGGQSNAGGGGGLPSVATGGATPGGQGNQGGGQGGAGRVINVNFEGEGLMSTAQVRQLMGQFNEQLGDGVTLNING